jgi:hypothetical protein
MIKRLYVWALANQCVLGEKGFKVQVARLLLAGPCALYAQRAAFTNRLKRSEDRAEMYSRKLDLLYRTCHEKEAFGESETVAGIKRAVAIYDNQSIESLYYD